MILTSSMDYLGNKRTRTAPKMAEIIEFAAEIIITKNSTSRTLHKETDGVVVPIRINLPTARVVGHPIPGSIQ